MLRFFRNIGERARAHKAMKQAEKCISRQDTQQALAIYESLVKKHPTNVFIRHKTATLQKELNRDIKLPDISPRASP